MSAEVISDTLQAPQDAGDMDPMDEQAESVITLYFEDHDRVKKLYHHFKNPGIDGDKRRTILDALITELTAQSAAEYEVLCPVLADRLGDALADHLASELASLKLVMGDLKALEGSERSDEYYAKIEQLMQVVMGHMHVQEHNGLRRLRSIMNSQSLADLGKAYAEAKARAPTDPADLAMGENEGADDGEEDAAGAGADADADADADRRGPERLAPAGPREGQVAA